MMDDLIRNYRDDSHSSSSEDDHVSIKCGTQNNQVPAGFVESIKNRGFRNPACGEDIDKAVFLDVAKLIMSHQKCSWIILRNLFVRHLQKAPPEIQAKCQNFKFKKSWAVRFCKRFKLNTKMATESLEGYVLPLSEWPWLDSGSEIQHQHNRESQSASTSAWHMVAGAKRAASGSSGKASKKARPQDQLDSDCSSDECEDSPRAKRLLSHQPIRGVSQQVRGMPYYWRHSGACEI